jgi:hypothetical protein
MILDQGPLRGRSSACRFSVQPGPSVRERAVAPSAASRAEPRSRRGGCRVVRSGRRGPRRVLAQTLQEDLAQRRPSLTARRRARPRETADGQSKPGGLILASAAPAPDEAQTPLRSRSPDAHGQPNRWARMTLVATPNPTTNMPTLPRRANRTAPDYAASASALSPPSGGSVVGGAALK